MSEKDNNLTPWQQKHLEYQKRKAEEAKKEKKANQPKKVYLISLIIIISKILPFFLTFS